jgi:hypothetical protein
VFQIINGTFFENSGRGSRRYVSQETDSEFTTLLFGSQRKIEPVLHVVSIGVRLIAETVLLNYHILYKSIIVIF